MFGRESGDRVDEDVEPLLGRETADRQREDPVVGHAQALAGGPPPSGVRGTESIQVERHVVPRDPFARRRRPPQIARPPRDSAGAPGSRRGS